MSIFSIFGRKTYFQNKPLFSLFFVKIKGGKEGRRREEGRRGEGGEGWREGEGWMDE